MGQIYLCTYKQRDFSEDEIFYGLSIDRKVWLREHRAHQRGRGNNYDRGGGKKLQVKIYKIYSRIARVLDVISSIR